MSSVQLISHHLFVAAVNEKSRASGVTGETDPRIPTTEVRAREIPIELVEFGRPLPLESSTSLDVLRPLGST